MNTQNAKNRPKYWKNDFNEDWLYFLISTQQPALLNIWLFSAVFCYHVYSILCKFGWLLYIQLSFV